jgi:hypothetical protein
MTNLGLTQTIHLGCVPSEQFNLHATAVERSKLLIYSKEVAVRVLVVMAYPILGPGNVKIALLAAARTGRAS